MDNLKPVLLAEDETADVFLMQRAFRLAQIPHPLVTVPDGQEAISYLEGKGPYADRTRNPEPCLLLLDLKMPVLSGFEVLEWLRARYGSGSFPIIVLTSSEQPADVRKAFELGAHDYLTKPMNFAALLTLVRNLHQNWLTPLQSGLCPLPPANPTDSHS